MIQTRYKHYESCEMAALGASFWQAGSCTKKTLCELAGVSWLGSSGDKDIHVRYTGVHDRSTMIFGESKKWEDGAGWRGGMAPQVLDARVFTSAPKVGDFAPPTQQLRIACDVDEVEKSIASVHTDSAGRKRGSKFVAAFGQRWIEDTEDWSDIAPVPICSASGLRKHGVGEVDQCLFTRLRKFVHPEDIDPPARGPASSAWSGLGSLLGGGWTTPWWSSGSTPEPAAAPSSEKVATPEVKASDKNVHVPIVSFFDETKKRDLAKLREVVPRTWETDRYISVMNARAERATRCGLVGKHVYHLHRVEYLRQFFFTKMSPDFM